MIFVRRRMAHGVKQNWWRAEFFALPITFHFSPFTVFLRRLRARTGTRKSHRDPAVKPHRDTK
jgi:hypothetical protein